MRALILLCLTLFACDFETQSQSALIADLPSTPKADNPLPASPSDELLPELCDPVLLAIMRLCARSSDPDPYTAAATCGAGQPPICGEILLREAAYEECVFGTTWYELQRSPWIRSRSKLRLDASTPLDPSEEARIVAAVQASSHTDVTTAAEAFSRVDENIIDRHDLIDTSSDRNFVAYIYGAGDNTYGRIFAGESIVSDVHDGDLDCHLAPGPIGTDCATPSDCPSNLTCSGITATAGGLGRCGPSISESTLCRTTTCAPAWLEQDLADLEGLAFANLPLDRSLTAYGLGDHLIAAELSLSLEYPNVQRLGITLIAPDGTATTIPTSTSDPTALELHTQLGSLTATNGTWRLHLEGPATEGTLHAWSLRLTTAP